MVDGGNSVFRLQLRGSRSCNVFGLGDKNMWLWNLELKNTEYCRYL